MLFAIDNYDVGKQREISASEAISDKYFYRKNRFRCPECNELVTLVDRINTVPYFRHGNRNDASPECDKRVDGGSNLTFYERVGLPICIQKDLGNSFKLYIGFPSLGHSVLQNAYNNKLQLRISDGVLWKPQERLLYINPTNFYDNQTTFIPIDFIPPRGQNYSISYKGSNILPELNLIWTDYADGFSDNGAIFSYSESCGKKVRRGGNITTEEDYYVVSKQFSTYYSEIKNYVVGTIYLNNSNYNVYLIRIDVSTNNQVQFKKITDYLYSTFGIGLLEKMPELITIWPPVVENDGLIPAFPTTKVFCSAISGNSMPQVFTYSGARVFPLPIDSDTIGNHTVSIPLVSSETVVSIDRKYFGSEVIYRRKSVLYPQFQFAVSAYNKNGEVLDITNSIILPKENCIYLSFNARADLYHKIHGERYKYISIKNDDLVIISDLKVYDEILIRSDSRTILRLIFTKPESTTTFLDDKAVTERLIMHAKGIQLPVPFWIRQMVKESNQLGYCKFSSLLKQMIECNKIQVGALKYLSDIKETFIND